MRKILACIIISFLICSGCSNSSKNSFKNEDIDLYKINIKRDILCLLLAYPNNIIAIEKDNNKINLVMKSEKCIIYNDNRDKEKSNNPDLEDTMKEIYTFEDIVELSDEKYDPGRIRSYELLNEVYGNSKSQIESNLVSVNGIGLFNRNNNAAKSLISVMQELQAISKNNKYISSFLYPMSGTYNYRNISGTGRLSPHAYGIAIDLHRDSRDYWKWATREQGQNRLNSYPREIVKTFEKYGFIWGGKWGHFDILHFEYRPEIIMKAKYFSKISNENKEWFSGITNMDDNTKSLIAEIDNALK